MTSVKRIALLLLWLVGLPLSVWADCTVNINTDSAEAIADCLIGIGTIKAEALVRDRATNGPFESVEALTRVSGIGTALVERNRDRIRIATDEEPGTGPTDSGTTPPVQFLLGSWNVRNLSSQARSDVELGLVALVLYRYDFIALQEILDTEVIFRLQMILNDDFGVRYEAQVSEEVGNNKKERYAFLWKAGLITQPQPASLYPDPGDKFEREPYCGRFVAGNFDFTICTVHILFGDSEAERRPEIRELDEVYQHFKGQGDEQDVVICGDFNFGPDDEGFEALLALDGMRFAIAPPVTTTIGDVSLYDNCFWSKDSSEIVAGSGQVLEFDELMFSPGSRSVVNRLVSDHRPISVVVELPQEDDD